MALTISSVVLFLLDYFCVGIMLGLATSPLPITAVIMAASPLVTIVALLQAARGKRSPWRVFINGLVLAGYAYLALYLFLPWPDSDRVRRELHAIEGSVTHPFLSGACGGRTFQVDYLGIESDAGAATVRAQFEEGLRANGWALELAPKGGSQLVTCASKGNLVAVLWQGSPHRDTKGLPDCEGVLQDGGGRGKYLVEVGVGRFRSCAGVRP
jgi:hypothetical protein